MMQKNEFDDKLRSSFSNSLRLILDSNTNRTTTSAYLKSHKNHTKIIKNRFYETFYLMSSKEREIQIRAHGFLY